MKRAGFFVSGLLAACTLVIVTAPKAAAAALVGAHSYTNTSTGDVFLGGDYIELGISKYGNFGTTNGQPLPTGFFGTAGHTNIGMSTNPTGFGVAPDLRMDFFLPGSPEERWAVGYKQGGTAHIGSNAMLSGSTDISDYTVTNQSSGDLLKAVGSGTLSSTLQTSQTISFNRDEKYFKNEVTLKNVGASAIDSVRYMHSFDPDNTVFQGGDYTTHNTIPYTNEAGDGKAVVVADSNVAGNSDPVYAINGSYSPILFYSSDPRARVSTYGFSNRDPYAAQAYDSALPKGTSVDEDQAITIAFDVGTLAPGASETVVYYTSLDNRDFTAVLSDIQNHNKAAGNLPSVIVEDAGPNNGDANGDHIKDSTQANVASLPNAVVGNGAYTALETDGDCSNISDVSINPLSTLGSDGKYTYPLGLVNFSTSCTTPGGSSTIKVYYDKQYDTSGWTVRKFLNGKFQTVPGATFTTAQVGNKTVTVLTYQVVDGGALDADGTANGTIVDPAGPAVLSTAAVKAPDTGSGTPANTATLLAVSALGISAVASGLLLNRKTIHAIGAGPNRR